MGSDNMGGEACLCGSVEARGRPGYGFECDLGLESCHPNLCPRVGGPMGQRSSCALATGLVCLSLVWGLASLSTRWACLASSLGVCCPLPDLSLSVSLPLWLQEVSCVPPPPSSPSSSVTLLSETFWCLEFAVCKHLSLLPGAVP